MDKSEILYSYNTARNKTQQIRILSELNDCSIDDIILVIADGLRGENKARDEPEPQKPDLNLIQRLEDELDRLDEEIKDREKRYQEVIVAMKIVMELEKGKE